MLRNQNQKKFLAITKNTPNFSLQDAHYWFQLKIKNTSPTFRDWFISLENPTIKWVRFYLLLGDSAIQENFLGNSVPFSKKKIKVRHFTQKYFLAPFKTYTLYAQINGGDLAHYFPIVIETAEQLSEKTALEYLFFGILSGVVLLMLCLNAFLFIFTKERSYLHYFVVLFGTSFSILLSEGIPPLFFLRERPFPLIQLYCLAAITTLIFQVAFTRSYLPTKAFSPRLDRLFLLIIPIDFFLYPLIFFNEKLTSTLIQAVYGIFILFVLILAVISVKKKYPPAWIFLAAWIVFIFSSLLTIIFYHLNLPIIFKYSAAMGMVLQAILFGVGMAERLYIAKKEKEKIQREALLRQKKLADSFARFVPMEFLKILKKEDVTDIQLGDSTERKMTVLFSDIRGFTALSEKMNVRENFIFLNNYLNEISPQIKQAGGFIDKFIGDAIMALFHESVDHALNAAIQMKKSLMKMNQTRRLKGDAPIGIGIGINTGILMLGTVGSPNRLDTTVIGDTVNLTDRIESLTKAFGVSIIASEATVNEIRQRRNYLARKIVTARVKGKTVPVTLFEIFNGDEENQEEEKKNTEKNFQDGLSLFKDGEFAQAKENFDFCLELSPKDTVASYYKDQCSQLMLNPPPERWDGILDFGKI